MAKKRLGIRRPGKRRHREYFLEKTTPEEIRATKRLVADHLSLYWRFYSELDFQRKQIEPELTAALSRAAAPFRFRRWQRAVKYRYSLDPLSTVGSLAVPGGRFNIGDIDVHRFPQFSALYLAEDKDTALQETLGQLSVGSGLGLTAREMALTSPDSESIVSVSGELDEVVDLRSGARHLEPFVALIRDFTLSPELMAEAKRLGQVLKVVQTVDQLLTEVLLTSEWRVFPMRFDVPSSSQLFGRMAVRAGINGIAYPSKLTGHSCAAIFPQTFPESGCYVQLDDEAPHPDVLVRVDASNWRDCEIANSAVARS